MAAAHQGHWSFTHRLNPDGSFESINRPGWSALKRTLVRNGRQISCAPNTLMYAIPTVMANSRIIRVRLWTDGRHRHHLTALP